MKIQILTFALILFSIASIAQTEVNLSLKKGYEYRSYYSFVDGEVKSVASDSWDLGFSTFGRGSTIRTHVSTNVHVYSGGIEDWETLDTAGIESWDKAYDSDTTWGVGAFSHGQDGSFNLGWGTYDINTHHVNGSRIFVLKLADQSYRKVMILKLASGVYTFKYADLDNENEKSASLDKSDYTNKNFTYYSLVDHKILDDEPENTDWDIVFMRYKSSEVIPNSYYGVTGILMNNGVSASKIEKVAKDQAEEGTYNTRINAIGYNWKKLNYASFKYEMVDSLTYFVNDKPGNVWKLTFDSFEGSSTGNVAFKKQKIAGVTSLYDNTNIKSFAVYPNPTNSTNVNVVFVAEETTNYQVSVVDLAGNVVYEEDIDGVNGLNTIQLADASLAQGLYIIRLSSDNSFNQAKFFVN